MSPAVKVFGFSSPDRHHEVQLSVYEGTSGHDIMDAVRTNLGIGPEQKCTVQFEGREVSLSFALPDKCSLTVLVADVEADWDDDSEYNAESASPSKGALKQSQHAEDSDDIPWQEERAWLQSSLKEVISRASLLTKELKNAKQELEDLRAERARSLRSRSTQTAAADWPRLTERTLETHTRRDMASGGDCREDGIDDPGTGESVLELESDSMDDVASASANLQAADSSGRRLYSEYSKGELSQGKGGTQRSEHQKGSHDREGGKSGKEGKNGKKGGYGKGHKDGQLGKAVKGGKNFQFLQRPAGAPTSWLDVQGPGKKEDVAPRPQADLGNGKGKNEELAPRPQADLGKGKGTKRDLPKEDWISARAASLHSTDGAYMSISGGRAWLPREKIKPLVSACEAEIREALKNGVRVRIVDGTGNRAGDMPSLSMWTFAEERSQSSQKEPLPQDQAKLSSHFQPHEWLQACISSVKNYGIFVSIDGHHDILVPIVNMSANMTWFDEELDTMVPNCKPGQQVSVRITGCQGSHRRTDRSDEAMKFRCTMLPIAANCGDTVSTSLRERANTGKGAGVQRWLQSRPA